MRSITRRERRAERQRQHLMQQAATWASRHRQASGEVLRMAGELGHRWLIASSLVAGANWDDSLISHNDPG